jgi:NAD(P)-dependent dehydrogenase (short-subunit alcohol dehydrogenase family)
MSNNGQVVLVTGASSGLGKETAKTLLKEGYTVYAAARRVERMDDLKKLGGIPIKMDITKEEDVVAAVDQITRDHGGVDILINNAGFGLYGTVEDVPLEEARYQFEVNMFGLARITQLVLPHMRQQRAGRIVNISSMGGKVYTPFGAWYHATKHALEGWSDCLRFEVKPFNIDVIVIEPGGIQTEWGDFAFGSLRKHSGQGPYRQMVESMLNRANGSNGNGRLSGSPPSVIANTVSAAIKASRPRTRYVAGSMARPLMLTRKWLGDRVYDLVLTSMVR